MTDSKPQGDLVTTLVLDVFRLHGQLLRVAEQIANPVGLTAARWQILGAIIDKPLTASAIARRMGLSRQAVQRLVDLLDKEGTVERLSNPRHRRAALIALTDEGRAAIARLAPVQRQWAQACGSHLGIVQLRQCINTIEQLSTWLESDACNALLSRSREHYEP